MGEGFGRLIMIVYENELVKVEREGKYVIAALKKQHQVISTSAQNGGFRTDIQFLVNHQSCEGKNHNEQHTKIARLSKEDYHKEVCRDANIPTEKSVGMGTAANMQYCMICSEGFNKLEVTAIVTAGVSGNAAAVGEPALWDDENGVWQKTSSDTRVTPEAINNNNGTINIMLLCNFPLSQAAFMRAVVTLTEAKTAALWELAIPSKKSSHLATGTGTDQFIIACPVKLETTLKERTWSGQHTKTGELIGKAVKKATLEALKWQNGIDRSLTRNFFHILKRHGLTEKTVRAKLKSSLTDRENELLNSNFESVFYDPKLAGCAIAFAALLDRTEQGALPPASAKETLLIQAALLSAVVATNHLLFSDFYQKLIEEISNSTSIELIIHALALGWKRKWTL